MQILNYNKEELIDRINKELSKPQYIDKNLIRGSNPSILFSRESQSGQPLELNANFNFKQRGQGQDMDSFKDSMTSLMLQAKKHNMLKKYMNE